MELTLTNKNGQSIDLLNNRSRFILVGAEGLQGIDINTEVSESPYSDGTTITNIKALPRGIELTFNLMSPVKSAIDYFTSLIKSKQYVTLTKKEGDKEITIKGVANIPPYSRMNQSCKIVLSIYCNQPYWEDLNYIIGEIATAISMLNFPIEGKYFTEQGMPFGIVNTDLTKRFINDGDSSIGVIFKLNILGTVVNPEIDCYSGEQNGWMMKLNVTLYDSYEVEICTIKNNKYITINGLTEYNGTPVINLLEFRGNDWLQLEEGVNEFTLNASSGVEYIYLTTKYKRRFE